MAHSLSRKSESRAEYFSDGSLTERFLLLPSTRPLVVVAILAVLLSLVRATTVSFPCPDGCFCDAMNDAVDCSGRGISTLPFLLSGSTRILLCHSNSFQWISPRTFNITNLRRLRKLSLADNLITGVEQGSLQSLTRLVQLDMTGNKLYRIPYDIRLLKSLNQLFLDSNEIKAITHLDFHNDSKLEHISLDNNQMKLVDSYTFSQLEFLQVLSLRNNSISNISSKAFKESTSLEMLDLSDNQIGIGDEDLLEMDPPVLNISDWFQLDTASSFLDTLLLSNNMMRGFTQDAFSGLRSLRTLKFQSNHILELSPDVFKELQSLEELVASDNQLEKLPLQLFKRLHRLRTCDLSFNLISYIPVGIFSTNADLEVVNMAGNQLEDAEWLLHASSSIIELYLSDNFIALFPESVLKFCPHLQVLELQNNALTDFITLWNATNIRTLDLTGNQITSIPSDVRFYHMHELSFLSLALNNLDTLDEDVFSSLPPLQEFLVYDNPFNCDCRLLWMDYLYSDLFMGVEIPPNIESWLMGTFESMVCEHPTSQRGLPVYEVALNNRNNFGCSEFADAKGIFGLVMCWVVILLVVVFAYWRWKVKRAERYMRAWTPKKKRKGTGKKSQYTMVSSSSCSSYSGTGGGETPHNKMNGKTKPHASTPEEYLRQFDRDSYPSPGGSPDTREYNPACVCLLQQEDEMTSCDILTETTV